MSVQLEVISGLFSVPNAPIPAWALSLAVPALFHRYAPPAPRNYASCSTFHSPTALATAVALLMRLARAATHAPPGWHGQQRACLAAAPSLAAACSTGPSGPHRRDAAAPLPRPTLGLNAALQAQHVCAARAAAGPVGRRAATAAAGHPRHASHAEPCQLNPPLWGPHPRTRQLQQAIIVGVQHLVQKLCLLGCHGPARLPHRCVLHSGGGSRGAAGGGGPVASALGLARGGRAPQRRARASPSDPGLAAGGRQQKEAQRKQKAALATSSAKASLDIVSSLLRESLAASMTSPMSSRWYSSSSLREQVAAQAERARGWVEQEGGDKSSSRRAGGGARCRRLKRRRGWRGGGRRPWQPWLQGPSRTEWCQSRAGARGSATGAPPAWHGRAGGRGSGASAPRHQRCRRRHAAGHRYQPIPDLAHLIIGVHDDSQARARAQGRLDRGPEQARHVLQA